MHSKHRKNSEGYSAYFFYLKKTTKKNLPTFNDSYLPVSHVKGLLCSRELHLYTHAHVQTHQHIKVHVRIGQERGEERKRD